MFFELLVLAANYWRRKSLEFEGENAKKYAARFSQLGQLISPDHSRSAP
jgi:hypothetical protein